MKRERVLLSLAALLAGAAPAAGQDTIPLSLGEAVRRAVSDAPAVRLAAARTEQSDAQVTQIRSALLPRLDLGASWLNRSYNQASMGRLLPPIPGMPALPDRIGPYDLLDTRLTVTQSLYDAGSRLAVRAAETEAEVSQVERVAEAEAAAARAALAYADAARARSVLAARAADLRLARELVRLAREQLEAGIATPLDVTRAETQRLTAEGDSLAASRQVSAADIELARVLGMEPGARLDLPAVPADLAAAVAPADAESALERALRNRPELWLQEALRRVHQTSRRAIQAERLPRVDLFGDVGWNGTTAENLIATRQFGVQVTVPLVDGWRREGRIAEQRILAEQAEIRRRELRLRVEAEVRTALLELASAADQRRVAEERLRLAELELEQARTRFREGVTGSWEVVDAQRALVSARDAVIAAEHQTASARIRLAQATGTARELR